MIISPFDVKSQYATYQLSQEWMRNKQVEKGRFTSVELAERYISRWSFLDRICAQLVHNNNTARYHAAKEYLKENK